MGASWQEGGGTSEMNQQNDPAHRSAEPSETPSAEEGLASSVLFALREYQCSYTMDDDENPLPLVDALSPMDSIEEGISELELLAEHIAVNIEANKEITRSTKEG